MENSEKRIIVERIKASELNTQFGNPRKIKKKKVEELYNSMMAYGDFGIYVIDENNSLIAGNQRWSVIMSIDPDKELLCKRLVGYSEAEKRAINIKDNTHSGEWDLDLLADWTADLNIDLGIDLNNQNREDRAIKDMELIHFEKYDYVMIVCKTDIDYNDLCERLGIEGKKIKISDKKRIRARAVWYDGKMFEK